MLREQLDQTLKKSMKEQNRRATSTVRLILTAVKDRDIAARGKGNTEGISDQEISLVLQTMIRQRHESIRLYEQGGRQELAQQEAEEITIIEGFLPRQLADSEMGEAIRATIEEISGTGLKQLGKVMASLRERYAGRMDFARASAILKDELKAREERTSAGG